MSQHPPRSGTRLGTAPLRFTFDGRPFEGIEGDTAASALLACGVRALGRSMKSRRLRGAFTAGPAEPGALLTLGTAPAVIPNLPAPSLALQEGMVLRSQNRWPSLHLDLASLLQFGGGLFGAGFYYKTFLWPSWHAFEPLIRRLAGLGEAPGRCELPPVAVEHLTVDVLVAGGGAAGLAAAHAAARLGASVLLCERDAVCGGELEFEQGQIDGMSARQWCEATLDELGRLGVRVLTQTTVVGAAGGEYVALTAPGGLPAGGTVLKIRPRRFVGAMGSTERPMVFAGNDLPGVMLLGAAERYRAGYGVNVGRRPVLFGNNDRLYAAALRFVAAGVRVRALIDVREEALVDADPAVRAWRGRLSRAGVDCLCGYAVTAAEGLRGVDGVRIRHLPSRGAGHWLPCDALLVSGGWTPEVHAGLHEGGTPRFDTGLGAFVAAGQPAGRILAGAGNGHLTLEAVLADGHAAGAAAAGGAPPGPAPVASGDPAPRLQEFWRSPATPRQEKIQFIDLQNDVTVSDLRLAHAEGLHDIEHVKRYTTLGMGTDQGRHGALNGAAILAQIQGVGLPQVGLSRTRPPYHPVPLQAIAGQRLGLAFRPTRRTPLHAWHEAHGGVMDPMGLALRPRYYRDNGPEGLAAAVAEARRVRATGGVLDGSTLGKIEVAGPDAGAYLDHLYLTRASTIPVGRSKYMMNLREDGMALDDGIVLRLGPERFLATTSSGHAEHMLSHFEFHRDTQWAGRAVTVTDVTDAWAVIAVAGPRSRDALRAVLGPAGAGWDAALATLAHMHFHDGGFAGEGLRVLRAGFSGELAYELHCRRSAATVLWQALVDQGLQPYGLDALDILRVEKGYLTASEINGQTTPLDLGFEALVQLGNHCVGREMLQRPAFHEPQRPRLVGLRARDGRSRLLAGAQITDTPTGSRPCGFVTSAAFSPALEQWVALALVARDRAAAGAPVWARDPLRGSDVEVVVTAPAHFDPAGERIRS